MASDAESTQSEGLVPPRPNLGPEPWPVPPGWTATAGWWVWSLALLLLIAGWRWRRGRSKAGSAGRASSPDPSLELDLSPRRRLIASSEAVRAALIGAFGPGWGSKTTEEIAAEPILAERLDPEEVGHLIEFLRQADRAKFAEDESYRFDDREEWVGSFVSAMAAGATSRIIGR
jgi:hypothetical protein